MYVNARRIQIYFLISQSSLSIFEAMRAAVGETARIFPKGTSFEIIMAFHVLLHERGGGCDTIGSLIPPPLGTAMHFDLFLSVDNVCVQI